MTMNISFTRQVVAAALIGVLPLIGVARNQREQKVPVPFNYPQSQDTIQIDSEIESRSLSGIVTDPSGAMASKVLVERVRRGWGKRISAVFSSEDGHFAVDGVRSGIHYLRVSKPGFNTMLLKIKVNAKSKSTLRIDLHLSN